MKKLTKTQKQNIKRKATKILNITCYVLSALFVLILIISMCKGCDSKSVNNNAHDSQQHRNNNIQYAINNDSDYMLPVGTAGSAIPDNPFPMDGKSSAYVMTDFDKGFFAISGITFTDVLTNLTENNTKVFNFPSGIYTTLAVQVFYNDGNTIVSVGGESGPASLMYSVEFIEGKVDSGILTYTYLFSTGSGPLEFSIPYSDENTIGLHMYFYIMFTTFRDNCEMIPFLIDTCTYMFPIYNRDYTSIKDMFLNNDDFYKTSYQLPPYLIIGKDEQSFISNIGLLFNGIRYNQIIYEYHSSFYFYNDIDNSRFDWSYTINVNGDYVFTPKLYDIIGGRTLYRYITDYSSQSAEIPKINFLAYGTSGLSFLNDYFLNDNFYYLNNNYNINIDYFTGLLFTNLPLLEWNKYLPTINNLSSEQTYITNFKYDNTYYKSFTLIYDLEQVSTASLNHVLKGVSFYINIGNTYIANNKTLSPSLVDIHVIENGNFEITSDLLEEGEYIESIVLTFDNAPISVYLWYYAGLLFVPYELNSNFVINDPSNDDIDISNGLALLGGAFSGIASILAITIIPGISIGVLIFIPLIIMIVLFIVHLFKR